MHGRMHYEQEFNDLLTCQKIDAYLENVIECLPLCKMSGGDMVEMFKTAPTRKHCHSRGGFDIILVEL